MEIRRIQGGELPAAMDLCWRVFLEFEAPEYPPEGVEAFRAYLSDIEQVNHLTLFGAWEGQELLGVLAAEGSHIALFFVDPAFHRQGIGRLLFQAYLAEGGRGFYVSMPWLSRFWMYFPVPLAGVAMVIFELEAIYNHIKAFFVKEGVNA